MRERERKKREIFLVRRCAGKKKSLTSFFSSCENWSGVTRKNRGKNPHANDEVTLKYHGCFPLRNLSTPFLYSGEHDDVTMQKFLVVGATLYPCCKE